MLAIKTILHPHDCSSHNENALHVAAALARDYRARLIVLHVKPPPETMIGEFGSPPLEPEPEVEDYLGQLKQLVSAIPDLNSECVVAEGRPVDEILRVAQENRCDLLILGSHKHTWLGRLWTVDVVNQVTQQAACPVLTVRSPD